MSKCPTKPSPQMKKISQVNMAGGPLRGGHPGRRLCPAGAEVSRADTLVCRPAGPTLVGGIMWVWSIFGSGGRTP